ncbi:MAG: VOC family protein [Bacteroidales bacterium]|nr:VOC family protein [Bacteroidales bacterium]
MENNTINMESVSPNIFVKDINETIKFYQSIGFETAMTVPKEGDLVWAMMSCGNVSFMFQTFESLGSELPAISRQDGGSLLLYIQVKGIRALHDKIKDKGTVIKGLEKTFYGATEFAIRDINNYILTFAENEK